VENEVVDKIPGIFSWKNRFLKRIFRVKNGFVGCRPAKKFIPDKFFLLNTGFMHILQTGFQAAIHGL